MELEENIKKLLVKEWLDLECLEYEIPKDKFKDGDNVEIIIRKVQKGE